MESQHSNFPCDCQSPTIVAGGAPLGLLDISRLWALRLVKAARRRAVRYTGVFSRRGRVCESRGEGLLDQAAIVGEQPYQAGDIVSVLGYDEIRATLDQQGKCDGLEFMEGMKPFCGRRFVVMKKVEMLFDEVAQRMLKIKKERYILEGVICNGQGTTQREGCDRCCFYFWGRSWLRKAQS
jgi:hypothetical protein